MQKILISACLLGEKVRYDGKTQIIENDTLSQWHRENRLVSICPEVLSGLPTPRLPAEIVGDDAGKGVLKGSAKVIRNDGKDISVNFLEGANFALELIQKHNIKIAIMKEKSPSCGSHEIYDGSFSNKKINAIGVTTALLKKHGVNVFSEHEIDAAESFLSSIEGA